MHRSAERHLDVLGLDHYCAQYTGYRITIT